ncbi:MAG: nitroreductase family protein [Candidatus Goldiibacteriota bacterium]|jgi:hypothetical protein
MAKKSFKINPLQKPQISKVIKLLKPAPAKDRSAFASLKSRKTTRFIGDKKLALQELSNILWAACGVNRVKGPFGDPGLTAASASNSREVDVYAFLEEGIYIYEAAARRLVLEAEGDFRAIAIGKGQLSSGSSAPLRLVYIADIDKFSQAGFQEPGLHDREIQKAYYYVDTGIIAGNVYLYAASQGLAAWFHNCDRIGIASKLNLRPGQRVLFGQTIGYPEKGK